VNALLVATALTVVAGAIVAVSSRDARIALAGLAVALVASPLLADPPPDALPLIARVLAALLAVELLWIAVRMTDGRTRGTTVGPAAIALAAAGASVVGLALASAVGGGSAAAPGSVGEGPVPAIVGAALGLGALAVLALVAGRDALRLAIGAALLVAAGVALQAGLVAPPSPFEQLVAAGASVAAGAAGALLVSYAWEARGDLSLVGHARRPDAHPSAPVHAPAAGPGPLLGHDDRRDPGADPGALPAPPPTRTRRGTVR
jgi:hypothetical protein